MGGIDPYTGAIVETMLFGEASSAGFALPVAIATYVFVSLSLYAIACRRGLRKPWLAWLPIGNLWLLGSISDQYQYLVKGRVNNRRKLLVGLAVATAALAVLFAYCTVQETVGAGAAALVTLLAFIALFGVIAGAVTVAVFEYICYFDLFRSCDPANGVLFLVLSIVFPGTLPFILFAIRKRDGGMPPRRQPVPQPVFTQTAAETVPVQPGTVEETQGGEINEQTIPMADA